jgi:peptidoglycan/LPS O-acetylase OafA/YrhL
LIAAAASLEFIIALSQGDSLGIVRNGGWCLACWIVCLAVWRREVLGGLLMMAGVSFALAQNYDSSLGKPFDGYETTLMSFALAVLMIPGALLLVSHRLRCSPSLVKAGKLTGPDPGVWPDWQWTARISSLLALLYTSWIMVLIGGNLETYGRSMGMVLCGFLAIGFLGSLLSWPFPRSGGLLLLLAAAGFSASLSGSGLQPWYGEPERTLGYIAITMPLLVAAFCQLTATKPRIGKTRGVQPSGKFPDDPS